MNNRKTKEETEQEFLQRMADKYSKVNFTAFDLDDPEIQDMKLEDMPKDAAYSNYP